MLTSGDVVELELGLSTGREAGCPRPAVVVTAQDVLDQAPTVVQVLPVALTLRGFSSEVTLDPGANGLDRPPAPLCQHVRAVSTGRIATVIGKSDPSTRA